MRTSNLSQVPAALAISIKMMVSSHENFDSPEDQLSATRSFISGSEERSTILKRLIDA